MTLATVQDDALYYYPGTKRKVKNWYGNSYRGLTSLREAMTQSMNVVAVKTLKDVSPKTGYDYLLNLGFTTLVDNYTSQDGKTYTDISLPLALGGLTKGVTNLELTNGFATIANQGLYHPAFFYTKIVDHDGNVLLDNTTNTNTKQVMKESTAWLLTSAMEDVISKGTGGRLKFKKSICHRQEKPVLPPATVTCGLSATHRISPPASGAVMIPDKSKRLLPIRKICGVTRWRS